MSEKAQLYTMLMNKFPPQSEGSPFYAGRPAHCVAPFSIFDFHILMHFFSTDDKDALTQKEMEQMILMGAYSVAKKDSCVDVSKKVRDSRGVETYRPFQDFVKFIMGVVTEEFKTAHTVVLCADSRFDSKHPKDMTRLKRATAHKSTLSAEQTKRAVEEAVFDYNEYIHVPGEDGEPDFYLDWQADVMANPELTTKAKAALMEAIMNYHSLPPGKRLLFYGFTGPCIRPLNVPGLQYSKERADTQYVYTERTLAIMAMTKDGVLSKAIHPQTHPLATKLDEGENSAVAIVQKCLFGAREKKREEKIVCVHSTDTDLLVLLLMYMELVCRDRKNSKETVNYNGVEFHGTVWINRGKRRFLKGTSELAPPKAKLVEEGKSEADVEDKYIYVNCNLLYTLVHDMINSDQADERKHLQFPVTNFMVPVLMGGYDFSHPIFNIPMARILDVYVKEACNIGPLVTVKMPVASWRDIMVTQENMDSFLNLIAAVYVHRYNSQALQKFARVEVHKYGLPIHNTQVLEDGGLKTPLPLIEDYLAQKTGKYHFWSLEEYKDLYLRILYCIYYNVHSFFDTADSLPSLFSMGYKEREVRADADVLDSYKGRKYIIPTNTDLVAFRVKGEDFYRVVCMPHRNIDGSYASVSTTPTSRT